jgi:hypothetical protein
MANASASETVRRWRNGTISATGRRSNRRTRFVNSSRDGLLCGTTAGVGGTVTSLDPAPENTAFVRCAGEHTSHAGSAVSDRKASPPRFALDPVELERVRRAAANGETQVVNDWADRQISVFL